MHEGERSDASEVEVEGTLAPHLPPAFYNSHRFSGGSFCTFCSLNERGSTNPSDSSGHALADLRNLESMAASSPEEAFEGAVGLGGSGF